RRGSANGPVIDRRPKSSRGGGQVSAAPEHRPAAMAAADATTRRPRKEGFPLPSFHKRLRFTAVAALSTVALGVGLFNGLAPVPGSASSHREAPLVPADPQVDGTDLYAFVSPDKPDTVTVS